MGGGKQVTIEPVMAFCRTMLCTWDHLVETEDQATVLETLHCLVKHPQKYKEMTGKEPEIAVKQYAEVIHNFRRDI